MDVKDIPLIGNYSYANETNNKYVKNYNIDSNQLYYKIMVDCFTEVDNHPKNINIHIPWGIRPHDCFGNDLSNGNRVAYITTYYDDRFEKICKGTIIGFTECFIKIKPDETEYWRFKEFKDGKWQPKEYILRKYNRVIKL